MKKKFYVYILTYNSKLWGFLFNYAGFYWVDANKNSENLALYIFLFCLLESFLNF